MLVIDEYLAVRVLGGNWPDVLPDDDLGLPAFRHRRLLQRVLAPRRRAAVPAPRCATRRGPRRRSLPHPEVLQVLDPRPLFEQAASILARNGAGGLLVAETLAAAAQADARSMAARLA